MPPSDFRYQFDGKVEAYNMGRYHYTVVFLPASIRKDLPLDQYPRLRIDGEVNGIAFNAAWQPAKGRWYLMISRKMQKTCRVELGDVVHVAFSIADQDAVDVPRELSFALEADSRAQAAWNRLTAGKRRGLAYRVASAKRPETRELRVEEVLETLLTADA